VSTILIYIEKLPKDVKTNYEYLRARQLVRKVSWSRARRNINISPLHSQRAHPQKSHRLVIIISLKLSTVTLLFAHHSSHSLHMYVSFFFSSAIFMSLQIFTSPLYFFFFLHFSDAVNKFSTQSTACVVSFRFPYLSFILSVSYKPSCVTRFLFASFHQFIRYIRYELSHSYPCHLCHYNN
jgi:hypothetical protein